MTDITPRGEEINWGDEPVDPAVEILGAPDVESAAAIGYDCTRTYRRVTHALLALAHRQHAELARLRQVRR